MKSAFHLALHVTDLDETRRFHGDVLGWTEGRSTETPVDFFGHQMSLPLGTPLETARTGKVGDHMGMMPHMGAAPGLDDWKTPVARLQGGGIDFAIPPVFRFNGQPGEECTAFFRDLSGNPPEIKGLADTSGILAS
ncbi:dioxygenase [Salipiger aestuarii]|uniref:VOC family protein n=1 Tax=Salipiger aestuarii TaxID=568098 RepID=UPI00123A0B1B|nr:dioxygenase [Salipiger aestuarii]KAA8608959.1 dioxygenase [Salipiger aestuarii]